MSKPRDFGARIGNVFMPIAEEVNITTRNQNADLAGLRTNDIAPAPPITPIWHVCRTTLREGCYSINYVPKGVITIFGTRYAGTVRVENISDGSIRFSGDLYNATIIITTNPGFPIAASRMDRIRLMSEHPTDAPTADSPGVIPIRSRKSYYSYLKGTGASLVSITTLNSPCTFSLTFDEFKYTHPATGFSGSFPPSPTRSLTFRMAHTATADSFTGTLMEGATELGSLSMQWVSPFFRRANVSIFRLNPGAANPPASVPAMSGGGTEDFHSAFATAGWDLSFSFAGDIPLPASLSGVQNPTTCWSQPNLATLLSSLPGYNPTALDTMWRAYLMAVPGALGCGRGQMFDTGSGNPNNIPREGAVTYSDDGYPTGDSSHFGSVANHKQRDVPRAFLRSASHELGHTFNQIHQELEGGSDNSIMTTTPSVADVLFSLGKSFPTDINLGFNARVRRHLIHLPDPAVRPGAIDFFGAAVNAPQADEMFWPPALTIQLSGDQTYVSLGEALLLKWTLTNEGDMTIPVPSSLDIDSLVARVSVTDPDDKITFLRPAEQKACVKNPLRELKPGESESGSTNVFWGRDGFTFNRPGRHLVEVVLMWQVAGIWVASNAETDVWVSFPVSEQDDRIAALLLHPDVGRAVAAPNTEPSPHALERLQEAHKIREQHPAFSRIKSLGMAKRLKLPE